MKNRKINLAEGQKVIIIDGEKTYPGKVISLGNDFEHTQRKDKEGKNMKPDITCKK